MAPSHLRWAVELRDPSWIHDDVLTVLARHDAALVLHDLLPGLPWERTASWTYLRFHGPMATTDPYRGRDTDRRLWRIADRIEPWIADGTDVYGFFNNDIGGAAVADALWFRRRLESFRAPHA